MTIEPAGADDASVVADVHAEAATLAYAGIFPADAVAPSPIELEQGWRSLIEHHDSDVFIERVDGTIAGVAALSRDDSVPAGLRLARLYVRPAAWGRGIGTGLHDHVIDLARRWGHGAINLWVLQDNNRGRLWYERRDWQHVPGPVLLNEPPEVVDVLYERALARPRTPGAA